jgi:FtsP/CotA-like multicopper oxidase with cupredoxin domain
MGVLQGRVVGARATLWGLAGLCLAASACADPVRADKAGCEYKHIAVGPGPNLQNPPEISSHGGVFKTNLVVQYTDPSITSLAGCSLHLRSYNGQLVGPTFRVRPSDVLNIDLDNRLPFETPPRVQAQFEQESRKANLGTFRAEFNVTNLHTHGLHVSPSGNSDNVLLNIPPQTSFPYEIRLPNDHPSGTFWYHAHAHGSTSIQVGSGMAGALIVEDDPTRIPAPLRDANKGEKILLLQTILYDRNGELEQIAALLPSPKDPSNCALPGNADTWLCSGRRVTINGQIAPRITMRPGEVQRWRIIDTAFRQSFLLRLEGHRLHEIALDGLYLGHIDTWQQIELQPGYRSDVLVQASQTSGTYKLINGAPPALRTISAVAQPAEEVIAFVVVEGEQVDMRLPTNEEMSALAPFTGVDLRQSADGVQEAVFKLGSNRAHSKFDFQINYQAFDHERVRQVELNTTDQWSLTTVGDPPENNGVPPLPHVFHIHVNPFQMVRKGPLGADELVWKDTVLVPSGERVDVYTRYLDYIGQFVLHCHILDHEDLGMMEVVEVVNSGALPLRVRTLMKHPHQ